MRPIRTALLAMVAAASLLSTPGCASVEDAKAKRTELLNHKTDLEHASANLAEAKAAAEARQADLERELAQTQALLEDTQDASARHELEVTIAGNVGGYTIREAGLFNAGGELLIHGTVVPVYKTTSNDPFEIPLRLQLVTP